MLDVFHVLKIYSDPDGELEAKVMGVGGEMSNLDGRRLKQKTCQNETNAAAQKVCSVLFFSLL